MRRSAESGSPWLPVEIATTLWSGKDSISRGGIKSPSGALAIPRLEAMLKFLRIERPTSATRRSSCGAASMTCWTRWTFEANEVTMIRPWQRREQVEQRRADARLRRRDPRTVGVGRVAAEAEHALGPSSARRETSAGLPSTGVWSNL